MADLDTASKRISSVGLWGVALALPLPDGTLGQGDRQHIAASYSGILAGAAAAMEFILDLNTRIKSYLCTLYSADMATADNSALVARYLAAETGDMNARFQKLITDSTP